jgi:uncharacterized protein YbcV (DUF1398 family)
MERSSILQYAINISCQELSDRDTRGGASLLHCCYRTHSSSLCRLPCHIPSQTDAFRCSLEMEEELLKIRTKRKMMRVFKSCYKFTPIRKEYYGTNSVQKIGNTSKWHRFQEFAQNNAPSRQNVTYYGTNSVQKIGNTSNRILLQIGKKSSKCQATDSTRANKWLIYTSLGTYKVGRISHTHFASRIWDAYMRWVLKLRSGAYFGRRVGQHGKHISALV